MEKIIIKDLYCFLCSLQFDKKVIYDIHQKIVHNYVSREEPSVLTEIKTEAQEIDVPTESRNDATTSGKIELTGRKYFACPHCNKTFTRSSSVKRHERIHNGKKPFACRYCDKTFIESVKLRRHERIHTSEKPFACKYCEKTFNQSGILKRHENIHTGEKPFICKYCNKTFSRRYFLKRHAKFHN